MVEKIAYFSVLSVEVLIRASFRQKSHNAKVLPRIPKNNSPADCTRSQPHLIAERWKLNIIKMVDAY